MAAMTSVGSVDTLWRFPVKSMGGEQLAQAEVSPRGLVGDRAYALIDAESGRVVSAKSVKQFPDLLRCSARFVEPPRSGRELPAVRITLPGGKTLTSDSGSVDRALSTHFRRDVTLARAAPEDFTIDQYHPDVEGADPGGRRDTVVAQKLGSAFFAQAGLDSPVPSGAFFDLFPVSVITTSSLARFAELQPASRFDARRFRMNVVLSTGAAGFPENDWIGSQLALGDGVRLRLAMPDPRCVMTTLAQDGLAEDTEVLRTLVRHNRIEVAGAPFPCAGAYAVVESPGTVRVHDRVTRG
jgi:hypothetical protein